MKIDAYCVGEAGDAKDRLVKAIEESNEIDFFDVVDQCEIDWNHIGHCYFMSACKGNSVKILEKFFKATPPHVLTNQFVEAKMSVTNYSVAQTLVENKCEVPLSKRIGLYLSNMNKKVN